MTTENTYDIMPVDGEPEPTLTQVIPAMNYYVITRANDGACRAIEIQAFEVYSNGVLCPINEDGEDLGELEDYTGIVYQGGADELNGEELKKLLEETKIEEV